MRTLLKITIDAEPGSRALRDGSLPKAIQSTIERLKPEATYFLPSGGKRTALIVFDLKDSSEIPSISEPFFAGVNATVEFSPVMNFDDLMSGLRRIELARA
ncbi:MAG: hypothetical protein KGM44_00475 [bacterium]|nr:hypothetical protein [bacterium]